MPPKAPSKAEPKRLKPPFAYSTEYPADGHGGPKSIHAYSDQAEERKVQFLRDARAYLKAVGEELRPFGFTDQTFTTNEAGVAVSGDVYAHYKQPGLDKWIYLTVGESCVRFPLAEPPEVGEPISALFCMTTRADGIVAMGRWMLPPRDGARSDRMGPNVYFDANMSSREVAPALLRLVDIHPVRLPEREARQASFFDLAA